MTDDTKPCTLCGEPTRDEAADSGTTAAGEVVTAGQPYCWRHLARMASGELIRLRPILPGLD